MSRPRPLALLLASVLLVAGCSVAGPAASPPPTSQPTAPPASPPAPDPTSPPPSSVAVTPSPSPRPTPSATGRSGDAAEIEGTSLSLELPDLWTTRPIDAFRVELEAALDSVPASVRGLYEDALDAIEGGRLRLYAVGSSGLPPWQSTMIVTVTPAPSVEAEIERVRALQEAAVTVRQSERSEVDLPAGPAIRIWRVADPPDGATGGVPAQSLDYFVGLAGGEVLWINVAGPEASPTFVETIDAMVATLASG